MSPRFRSFLSVLLGIAACGLATAAHAQTSCVSPAVRRLAGSRAVTTPLVLTWQGPGRSRGGRIQTTGAAPTLVQQLPPLERLPFSETLMLPSSTVQALVQNGTRRLLVVREVDRGGVNGSFNRPATCVASLELASNLGGPLAIRRIQLRFEPGSALRIVARDQPLQAWADLEYVGSGELVAQWEVAEPGSTSGAPVFRPLARLRRQIEGGGRVSLRSPDLPTDRTGVFLVRLMSIDPDPAFDEPVLRYYVAADADSILEPVGIIVREPANQALLDDDTIFRWSPIPGARAYRLELHPASSLRPDTHLRFDPENPSFAELGGPGGQTSAYETQGPRAAGPSLELARDVSEPIAGALIDGGQSEAKLSAWARSRLEPGKSYVWVVRALASGEVPIGMSPPRLLRVPEAQTP